MCRFFNIYSALWISILKIRPHELTSTYGLAHTSALEYPPTPPLLLPSGILPFVSVLSYDQLSRALPATNCVNLIYHLPLPNNSGLQPLLSNRHIQHHTWLQVSSTLASLLWQRHQRKCNVLDCGDSHSSSTDLLRTTSKSCPSDLPWTLPPCHPLELFLCCG